jgi:hypothetical protein
LKRGRVERAAIEPQTGGRDEHVPQPLQHHELLESDARAEE